MNWRRFWQRRKRDRDLAQEIESYLAHESDLLETRGLKTEESAWAAQKKLGNQTAVKEKVWDMNTIQLPWGHEHCAHDVSNRKIFGKILIRVSRVRDEGNCPGRAIKP